MRVLITGVTGFIGSHVAELCISEGDQLIGITRSGRWRADVPPELAAKCRLRAWDIVQAGHAALFAEIQAFSPEVVYHFAGMSIPSQCGQETPTRQAFAVNVGGANHVLDMVQQLEPQPKFVFASTVHVYARVDSGDPYVSEDAPLDPISAYGKTKLACETNILGRMYGRKGVRASIVRGFHHVGPRQPQGLMLTDWLSQLATPGCVELKVKSTNSYLDIIDVRDAAVAYRLLGQGRFPDGIYNLGSGRISKSGDVLQAILKHLGRTVRVVEHSSVEQWNAIADIRKLRLLGWNPRRSYHDAIASMIATANRAGDR